MGFDWEEILDDDGAGIEDAYEEAVFAASRPPYVAFYDDGLDLPRPHTEDLDEVDPDHGRDPNPEPAF